MIDNDHYWFICYECYNKKTASKQIGNVAICDSPMQWLVDTQKKYDQVETYTVIWGIPISQEEHDEFEGAF